MNSNDKDIAKRQKAVALEQQGNRQDIPKITASGVGTNAEKILRLAFDNDVKVRKDEELVEILSQFDVDSLIPVDALSVVSEILSHVYQENVKLDEARHNEIMQKNKLE
jgi:flagellar biosynthesis protein|tara:strand:- start:74619 stop:74945 length:327 start_codon:yes stop_codon:yes gene_type:complete